VSLPVQTRVYLGKSQADAAARFNADAAEAWQSGYQPVNQVWKGPNWLPAIIIPIVLFVIVVIVLPVWEIALALAVIVGVIYIIAARPHGQLTVTYVLRSSQ
jgi:hypothetical protein